MSQRAPDPGQNQAQQQLLLVTDGQANILYASPALCRLAGFGESALQGRPASCLRHPDMPPGPIKDLWATLGRGQSWMGMLQNRRADGQPFWVDAFISPVLEDGKVREYQAIYRLPQAEAIQRASAIYRTRSQGRQPAALRWQWLTRHRAQTLLALLAFSPLGLLALSHSPLLGGAVLAACASLCWLLLSLHGKPFAVLVAGSRRIV